MAPVRTDFVYRRKILGAYMNISYEVTNADGVVIHTVTGTTLRKHFGVDSMNPIFNEQLVNKFNLFKECEGSPERMRQTISNTMTLRRA